MITKSIKSTITAGLLCCGIATVLTACSDTWDDHYEGTAMGGSAAVQEGTLWQAIQQNGQLSNFARVVQACGYDKALNGSQVFTVFAPTNEQFAADEADALISQYNAEKSMVSDDDNTVIKEFLQNHIALYNYSVSPKSNDTITLMNGKYAVLTATQLDNAPLSSTNQLYDNGVLFTVSGKVDYFPNVFEYLRKDADLDSLSSFFYNSRYYRREFQEDKSVAGSIVDGKTVFLDSVYAQVNDLFDYEFLNAKLNKEDSTYLMVAPTNQVWQKLIEAYEPCFNYDDKENNRDSLAYTNARLAIVQGTVFSRTVNTDAALGDSAMSTNAVQPLLRNSKWGNSAYHYYQFGDGTGYSLQKPLQSGGVLYGSQPVVCSNGEVLKADGGNWNFNPLNTFYRPIIIEAEGQGSIKSVSKKFDSTTGEAVEAILPKVRSVSSENSFYGLLGSNAFVEFSPLYSQNDSVTFNIREVLSNIGYDIYLVMAPALANDSNATATERLPLKLNCTLTYNLQDGSSKDEVIASGLVTTPDQVDYLLLTDDFKFPCSSYGLGSESDAKVTLRVDTNVRPSEYKLGTYTRTLRIDRIMLIPHGMAVNTDDEFGIHAHGDGVVYTTPKK
ncbi:MAG: fasciclin domain-containing protein [Prevotella sp.]|nr:fasciclin domain-containing protein [Prevotella sp.]MBQ8487655.1 fasciclin domain-containing protein [Prevotella sp.]